MKTEVDETEKLWDKAVLATNTVGPIQALDPIQGEETITGSETGTGTSKETEMVVFKNIKCEIKAGTESDSDNFSSEHSNNMFSFNALENINSDDRNTDDVSKYLEVRKFGIKQEMNNWDDDGTEYDSDNFSDDHSTTYFSAIPIMEVSVERDNEYVKPSVKNSHYVNVKTEPPAKLNTHLVTDNWMNMSLKDLLGSKKLENVKTQNNVLQPDLTSRQKNIMNKLSTTRTRNYSFTESLQRSTQPSSETVANIKKYKHIRLKYANGKVIAELPESLRSVSADDVQVLSKILSHAQNAISCFEACDNSPFINDLLNGSVKNALDEICLEAKGTFTVTSTVKPNSLVKEVTQGTTHKSTADELHLQSDPCAPNHKSQFKPQIEHVISLAEEPYQVSRPKKRKVKDLVPESSKTKEPNVCSIPTCVKRSCFKDLKGIISAYFRTVDGIKLALTKSSRMVDSLKQKTKLIKTVDEIKLGLSKSSQMNDSIEERDKPSCSYVTPSKRNNFKKEKIKHMPYVYKKPILDPAVAIRNSEKLQMCKPLIVVLEDCANAVSELKSTNSDQLKTKSEKVVETQSECSTNVDTQSEEVSETQSESSTNVETQGEEVVETQSESSTNIETLSGIIVETQSEEVVETQSESSTNVETPSGKILETQSKEVIEKQSEKVVKTITDSSSYVKTAPELPPKPELDRIFVNDGMSRLEKLLTAERSKIEVPNSI